jgi:hypothetical protein
MCCNITCLTNADVPGGVLNVDIESDCAAMDCPDAELEASGSGEDTTWVLATGCDVQAVMSCEDGEYSLALTVPMCLSLTIPGTVISSPGDPLVIHFPSTSFSGNMFCCAGSHTVEATVTQP